MAGRFQDIIYDKVDNIAKVTLNRPDKYNALSQNLLRELREVLDEINDDEGIRVVILTGAGDRAFSTGFDLSSGELMPDEAAQDRRVKSNFDTIIRIWNLRQPVISAVNGYAIAAGSNLAMVCDITVAAENAAFGEPEIRHFALSPLLLLPYITGYKHLHYLYYTGDTVDAQEALKLGMVNKVVPLAELQDEAMRVARRIAMVPPYAVQTTKRSIKGAYEMMGFKNAMEYHRSNDALVLDASRIPEKIKIWELLRNQGFKAFLEYRDGPFKEQS